MNDHNLGTVAFFLSGLAVMISATALSFAVPGLGVGSNFNFLTAATIVPGQVDRNDSDGNHYPDAGVTVTGKYTSVYAYDDDNWYWDLGDGRIQGSVATIDALDPDTLTTCNYQVQYRGNFENNPYLDSGWIINNINCKGYDDNGKYNYLIVHQTDPRYENNADWAIWDTWEYHVATESKVGNLTRPEHQVN